MNSANKKPFQKFGSGGGRKPFKKFNKKGVKKDFLQNARGYGRKGNFGRGTHIEEEDFTYYVGILQEQRSPAESMEQKVAMANNVLEQTKENEIHLSSNQLVSKVLENVIGYCDPEHLERYFKVFGENLRPICSDDFCSHVLEKLIEIAFIRAVGVEVDADEDSSSKAKRPRDIFTELKFNTSQDFAQEHRTKCSEFVLRICKFLLNNMEDFVMDPNAHYLIRSAILTLAGVHIPKTVLLKGKVLHNSEKFNGLQNFHRVGEFKLDKTVFNVPAEWSETLMEFPGRLQMWPQFKDFPYNNRTSVMLQIICIALDTADKKALDDFGKKLINDAFMDVEIPKNLNHRYDNENDDAKNGVEEEANGDGIDEPKSESAEEEKASAEPKEEDDAKEAEEEEDNDDDKEKPSVFKSDSSIRLLQALIAVASPKLLTQIYALFEDRWVSLANNKFGVYAVQRYINYVSEKSEFEAIFDKLCPHFEKFLMANKSNLLSSISATCLRLKTKQAAFITALQNILHCNASQGEDRPKAFFNCLTKLKPFELLPYEHKTYVGLFGSLIIQDILQFNKPIFLVNSILETPVKNLVEILQFPNGSFIADKFLSSPAIGEKSREKFVKHIEGFYLDLALTQSGSRVVELLIKASSDSQKVVIAKELIAKENKLRGTMYGRILFSVLKLGTFKMSPEQWKLSLKSKNEAEPEVAEKGNPVEKMETSEVKEEDEATETKIPPPNKNKKNKKRPAS